MKMTVQKLHNTKLFLLHTNTMNGMSNKSDANRAHWTMCGIYARTDVYIYDQKNAMSLWPYTQ